MILRIFLTTLIIGLTLLSDGCCGQLPSHQLPSPSAASTASPQPTSISPSRPSPSLTPTPSPTPFFTPSPTPTEVPISAVEVPARDLLALAARLKGISEPIPVVVNETPPSYKLGDREVFWVGNTETGEQFQVTATLRVITPHLYMWVEEGYEVDQAALERSAQRFEEQTYPINRAFFGSEWTPGVDNDIHLSILNTHGLGSGIGGYYSSADEFSHLVNPFSNEREIFYINLDILRPGTEEYDGTLAHEFQHMIHWANDRNEDAWVNEGFSTLAEYLNGYGMRPYFRDYLRAPDTQLTAWALTGQPTPPHYGASYLFTLYFLERFGEDAARQVVAQQAKGTDGFEAVLSSRGLTFDEVFADWVVANYLDDSQLEGGKYGYAEAELPKPVPSAEHDRYPVRRTATVHQYGADYILLRGRGDLRVTFQGAPQVKVVPDNPHSGHYQWWSNYGDESDMTLTRSFDLRGLERATLEVWLWYNIEEGWDYAYVEVSTDEGRSWHILSGEHTTDYNPNGNAFGVGYTGRSGGGEKAEWVRERIDLTPYVGQEVLLRFEYVTDDAVNHPGFCVDDIAIPELGYRDDAEGNTGWEAAGFVRTDNRLDQRFLVQVIEMTDPPRVRRMRLNEGRRGEILIQGLGRNMQEAVLVVSGLTPVTMETAVYTYTIEVESTRRLPLLGSN